jgi:hypothetical protein
MPSRFGEEISEQDAYNTAREALSFVSDDGLTEMDSLAHSPIQQQALADERAARLNA